MSAQMVRAATVAHPVSESTHAGCLHHPVVDFLLLGGGSLILILAIAALRPTYEFTAGVSTFALALAHVINHPHFAHSYQLFYRDFREKLTSQRYTRTLRVRYFFAGVGVPTLLVGFLFWVIVTRNVRLLGEAANLMGFLVGWHYVKQGYGILIVASALERRFFTDLEKRVALANAYACWLCFWLTLNWLATERNLWGIKHYSFDIPFALLATSCTLAAASSLAVLALLVRKWFISQGRIPLNGVVAYLTTIYVWLALFLDPVYALVIPACHSLQYLAVVWRYKLNLEHGLQKEGRRLYSDSPSFRFGAFLAIGTLMGYFGFWGMPEFLDGTIEYDRDVFGNTLFMFAFWIFINIHHYAMDNVMWRRGNPDTAKYLFGTTHNAS